MNCTVQTYLVLLTQCFPTFKSDLTPLPLQMTAVTPQLIMYKFSTHIVYSVFVQWSVKPVHIIRQANL